jgi:hypothetical protein
MVDYVAVLRRTIDALPKNTPEIRARVYEKARATVQSKLAMINPPPSDALIAKQMSGLEVAIGTVEADFAVALEPAAPMAPIVQEADPLADILNALPNLKAAAPVADEAQFKPADTRPLTADLPPLAERGRLPDTATLDLPEIEEARNTLASAKDSFDNVFGDLPASVRAGATTAMSDMPTLDDPVVPPQFARAAKPKGKPGRLLLPLLGLAILGGAGAYGWTERDRIETFVKSLQPAVVASQPNAPAAPAEPSAPPVNAPVAEPAATPATPAEPDAASPQKFTQRLNADGTEIDAGAGVAGGEQSVAQLEPAAEPATPAETPATPPVEPTPPAAEAPAEPATPAVEPPAVETPAVVPEPATPAEAVPVGQKAIFYEERTSGSDGSARTGAVVWSVVRESPGNDRPPEPAVRGDLSIPEAGLNVRMTLRRNADATLPASHILELIMTVPDDFAGGTIEDVQRVNLKPSEADAGAPLNATPVKVADKYFLVALENSPAAIKSNLALLRDQSWIDLPVVYRSGRRALFTMEKGLVGDQVFKQVLDAWNAAPLQ